MTTDHINEFLGSVDLSKYRNKYARIKLVELDMPRNIQAIQHLYDEYWVRRSDYNTFENFYEIYATDLKSELEEFRRKMMFSNETFYRGLPARIYRTWASLLTQIQGGYVAEDVYGPNSVEMSAPLDYKGIDMRINDGGKIINVQIKKVSVSREVRAPWHGLKYGERIINITYEVPSCTPLTSKGKPRVPFVRWQNAWQKKLQRLDNGFIIFMPEMFSRESITIP